MFALYKINKLSNGIRVVTENIDYVRSVSAGVWVGAGSALENDKNNGISHFIEHMLFKGTNKRSAKEIAEYMDSVGGQLNAMTATEYTCYYTKTLTEDSDRAFEILSDMITNSTFTKENINTERRVISEEISMCEDTPEDSVHELLSRIVWRDNPLGMPIAGTEESISDISRQNMLEYCNDMYCGDNMVLSVVGNFDEAEVMSRLEEKFGSIKAFGKERQRQDRFEVKRGFEIDNREIEQCHICMGLQGLHRNDENLYDLLVINALLGGNMSSRLFQSVREEAGLAYSIYSYANTYTNNGSLVIYAGIDPDGLEDTFKILNKEMKLLKLNKLSDEEINIAKAQMRASVVMGIESMSSRMSSYGKSVLFDNRIKTPEEITALIERVNKNTVADTIDRVFNIDKLNIAITGKVSGNGEGLLNIMDF